MTMQGLRPGALEAGPLLELFDGALLLQGEADIVEAFHQAALAERINLEPDQAAVGASDLLRGEVDRKRGVGAAPGIVDQLVDLRLRQRDGKDAVLEAVVVEDVGEGRRDQATNAEIEQRPRRVLARGAAAEILAGYENLRFRVGLLVEDEFRQRRARLVIAQFGEQAF